MYPRGQMSVWNCFDLALLMVQYVELVVAEVLILAHADVGETLNALSFWRVIRLLRILRIVRLLRGIARVGLGCLLWRALRGQRTFRSPQREADAMHTRILYFALSTY